MIFCKLEAETLKTDGYDNTVALFSRSSTSDFLRFNDNRILDNVVNILFYFSVMRHSLKNPILEARTNLQKTRTGS